ncbi:hypothetical protein LP420_21845 [Massilia sp. B-10]|nr:hypothetical protein LP420_21845 [Massilia sp. B-10]
MPFYLLYALLAPPAAPPPEAVDAPKADPFAFVRSMEGTRPDGDVRADPDGELVVDAELGHLFDYYLVGLGEKTCRRSAPRSSANWTGA